MQAGKSWRDAKEMKRYYSNSNLLLSRSLRQNIISSHVLYKTYTYIQSKLLTYKTRKHKKMHANIQYYLLSPLKALATIVQFKFFQHFPHSLLPVECLLNRHCRISIFHTRISLPWNMRVSNSCHKRKVCWNTKKLLGAFSNGAYNTHTGRA